MQVRVGPVSAGSVTAWVGYGRTVLSRARDGTDGSPTLEPAVRDLFEGFLDEWATLARHGGDVVWVADVVPEQVEFLTHAFYRLAAHLADQAERRGYPAAPPEGDEFYQALVAAIIDALGQQDRATGEFSEQLRQAWPGLKEP
jgi:hypothetical protein